MLAPRARLALAALCFVACAAPAPAPAPSPAPAAPAPATPAPAGAPTEPTPAPAPKPACGRFDHFRMYYGNPLSGIDVLEIDARGQATYFVTEHRRRGVVHEVVHELQFTLPADTLAALQSELDAIDFCGLEPKYDAKQYDGLQQSYSLWHGERRTRVYCDNLFPPPIVRLRGFLRERVLPDEAAMKAAKEADPTAFQAAIARAE